MGLGKWVALIATGVLTALVPLAYGSPPDPTWVSGIYDNADYDDVVGLVTDGAGVNNCQAQPTVGEGTARYVLHGEWSTAPSWSPTDQLSRGPPIDSQRAFARAQVVSSFASLRICDVPAPDQSRSGLYPDLNESPCLDV